jgi:hypothetical protein
MAMTLKQCAEKVLTEYVDRLGNLNTYLMNKDTEVMSVVEKNFSTTDEFIIYIGLNKLGDTSIAEINDLKNHLAYFYIKESLEAYGKSMGDIADEVDTEISNLRKLYNVLKKKYGESIVR